MFFNLYTYNEFIKDVYHTNKTVHYELLLREYKFDMSVDSSVATPLPKGTKKHMKERQRMIDEQRFSE